MGVHTQACGLPAFVIWLCVAHFSSTLQPVVPILGRGSCRLPHECALCVLQSAVGRLNFGDANVFLRFYRYPSEVCNLLLHVVAVGATDKLYLWLLVQSYVILQSFGPALKCFCILMNVGMLGLLGRQSALIRAFACQFVVLAVASDHGPTCAWHS